MLLLLKGWRLPFFVVAMRMINGSNTRVFLFFMFFIPKYEGCLYEFSVWYFMDKTNITCRNKEKSI